MLIAELLEDLPNDAERFLFLKQLENQIKELKAPLQESIIKNKLNHSKIKVIERRDWKPSQKYEVAIKNLQTQIVAIKKESQQKKEGKFEITTYLQVSEPKENQGNTEPSINPDLSSFFRGNPNDF